MRISDWSSDVCSSDLALVTVEREGVLASYVTEISGKDPVIEVKMPGSYAPDVYVSVLAVRGRVDGFWSWLSHLAYKWGLPFGRSEEHTSELQSLMRISYAVFCLKKKRSILTLPHKTHSVHYTNETIIQQNNIVI